MRRGVRILILVVLILGVGFLLWLARYGCQSRSGRPQLGGRVQSVLTNAVESAKNRFTGGVGVMLRPGNGPPIIQGIGVGSPAEAAGLRVGDVVLQVNGVATAGVPLAQVVENFRGFTGGRVEVTVQRAGSSNLTCVIRRTSWNTLRGTTFNQTLGTNQSTPLSPLTNGGGGLEPQKR